VTVARLVSRERTRLWLALAARGAGVALAIAAVVVAAGTLALGQSRWITRPGAPLAVWGVALAIVAAVLWWTRRDVRRTAAPGAVAQAIERERSLRAGSLRAALEVADLGALGRHAADTLAARLATQVTGRTLAPALHRRALSRGAVAAFAGLAGITVLGAARTRAPDGWRALRHPVGALTGSILAPIQIVDPPRAVMRGEKVRLEIRAPERRALTLRVRATGRPWESISLPVRGGATTAVLGPLDADLAIVASDGRMRSDTALVRVTDRPFVGDVAIRATYPAYLDRPSETIPVGEPARVPRGTVLSISGRASTELARVGLVRERDTLHLEPDGHAFTGRLVAVESGRWGWFAAGGQGSIADLPQPLELEVIADSAPRVDILAPAKDTVVLADARVTLRIAAEDDHGLSAIVLRTRRERATGAQLPELTQSVASPGAPQWNGEQVLDLAPRGLEPGDAIRLTVAATDNSPWRQTTVSRELVLRVPTLSEQRERARAQADSTVSRIASIAKRERDLAQRTSEAARTRTDRTQQSNGSWPSPSEQQAQERSMTYQSAEQAKALAREQQDLQEQVKQAQRDAKSLEQQLRAAGVLDSSLTKQLRDVQQLLQQALTPELQKQLDDVLKATRQLSPDDVRRAMENLAKQQEQLRQQLERSAEMLQRAALEGAMQSLHDEARDIARQERATADSLARGRQGGDSSLARNAKELSQRSRDLSRDVADLAKRLQQQQAESGPQKLQGASQRADSSAGAMQRAAQQAGTQQQGDPRQGDPQQGNNADRAQRAGSAQQAAQQMERVAQQLGDARQSQIQEWKDQLTSQLDRSIQETMQLAREQQRLADRARSPQQDDGLRGDQSAVQQGVEQLQQRLEQAARRSSHVSSQSQGALGEAQQRVREATQRAAEGSSGAGGRGAQQRQQMASAMESAARALERAAGQMMQDRARAASGSSASGFAEMLERMREAAKQQGAVNAQSAGLLPVPGGQPSPQMMAEARALAQRQREIARKLEDAGDGQGRAAELAKEMRDIASSLDRGRVDPSILERQQRLFHRLLDAGLTLEKDEREDTGKRESQTAQRDSSITTGTQSSGRATVRYREPTWNELRGLSADERRAVLEYFKRINADRP
jgi:hypothetical protein